MSVEVERAEAHAQEQTPPKRRVLIADDDPAVLRALALRCRRMGLEVDTADNGLQAILKSTRNPPSVLILDINMPEADGFRVCEWLLDPKRPPMHVIMVSGRSDLDTWDRCDSLGAFLVPKDTETWSAIKELLAELLDIDAAVLDQESKGPYGLSRSDFVRESRPRVLIAEDDEHLLRVLQRRLEKCGAEVFVARDGIEAFRAAAKEAPDVIIADYRMPEGGGHYLLWRVRSTATTRHIPIVVISGQFSRSGAEIAFRQELRGHGENVSYLPKPLDMNALMAEISRHCSIRYEPDPRASSAPAPEVAAWR